MIFQFNYEAQIIIETKSTKIPDLVVFRKTTSFNDKPSDDKSNTYQQGFVNDNVLKKSVKFPEFIVPHEQQFYLVKKEFINWCLKNDFFYSNSLECFDEFQKNKSRDLFSDVDNENYEIIKIDYSNHIIYDFEEKPIPQPIKFNYLDGYTHNGCYYIKKAEEILKLRNDIVDFEIKSIPKYNRNKHMDREFSFIWLPEKESYKKIIQQYLKEKDYNGKYKAIFDLDLLGLQSGGAAKYKDFYASDNYPCGK